MEVFNRKLEHQWYGVGVVGKKYLLGSKSLLGISEVYRIGKVYSHADKADNNIVPIEGIDVPLTLAQM